MSLLKQNITRKRQIDEKTSQLKFKINGKDEEYKVEAIGDSMVYARELESSYLPSLYYLISWKDFTEEENT